MNQLDLVRVAIEILKVHNDLPKRLDRPWAIKESDFDIHFFKQLWSNTSGGFCSMGGSAMTFQYTYVLTPTNPDAEREGCFVYFGGEFGYKVPANSEVFFSDLKRQEVVGVPYCGKYMKENGGDSCDEDGM